MRSKFHDEVTVIIKPDCTTYIYTYKGVYVVRASDVKFIPSNSDKIKILCINREGDE